MDINKVQRLMESEMTQRGTIEKLTKEVSENLICVLWGANQISYIVWWKEVFNDTCTTGANWFWNEIESYKTPIWLHQVDRVIWEWENNLVRISWKRVFPENIVTIPDKWEILKWTIVGRVLTLKWLEPKVNLATLSRDVYIHGTPHTWFWDTPDKTGNINLRRSLWCLWLRPEKVEELVDTHMQKTTPYVYISTRDTF